MAATEHDAIGIGMAIAAGIAISAYGAEQVAEEILGAAGLTTVKAMRECGVETYDIRLCVPALRTFRDKERWKAAARAILADKAEGYGRDRT